MNKLKINLSDKTKKKIKIGTILLLIIIIVLSISLYIGNENVRTFFDRYILRKEVVENNVSSIDLSNIENPRIYAYDKYITILNKNILSTYSSSGKKEYEHEIAVSDPLFSASNRFLAVAQKNGTNLYLVSGSDLLWNVEIEDTIQKVNVNKNGYVCVITSGSSYKTVIYTFSPAGKELFKTYLSSTSAIDASISNDNKYLSVAEINTSGTVIQSNIKIISIEKAQNDPTNSVIYTYNAEANKLIVSIKYQDKNRLAILYDDGIYTLYEEKEEQPVSFKEAKITFSSVDLSNYTLYTIEKSSGLFNSNTQVILRNTDSSKENVYTAPGTLRDVKTHDNNIALNLGSEVHFINTNGWLTKKYVSEKEINDIVLGQGVAGIVYKDKIEIINL